MKLTNLVLTIKINQKSLGEQFANDNTKTAKKIHMDIISHTKDVY